MKDNTIYNEDCEETMAKMKDKSIDFVLTSPPYNFGTDAIHNEKNKYGEYSDNLGIFEYFEWQKRVISELIRVTKGDVFYNIQMLSNNKQALFKLIGYFYQNIKEILIWDKINAEPAILEGCLNSTYEFIIVFTDCNAHKRRFLHSNFNRGTFSNIIRNKKNYGNENSGINSACMPLDFARKIILNFTKENELIYDPFSGLGTTAICCMNEGRRYMGSEIAKSCFDESIKRIKNNNQISLL